MIGFTITIFLTIFFGPIGFIIGLGVWMLVINPLKAMGREKMNEDRIKKEGSSLKFSS